MRGLENLPVIEQQKAIGIGSEIEDLHLQYDNTKKEELAGQILDLALKYKDITGEFYRRTPPPQTIYHEVKQNEE